MGQTKHPRPTGGYECGKCFMGPQQHGLGAALDDPCTFGGDSPGSDSDLQLMVCRKGHVMIEGMKLMFHDPQALAPQVGTPIGPGTIAGAIGSSPLPVAVCPTCLADYLGEEFGLKTLQNPEAQAAYKFGGITAARTVIEAQRAESAEDAVARSMAVLEGHKLSPEQRAGISRIVEEVVNNKHRK